MLLLPSKGLTASKAKAVLKKNALNLNDLVDKGQMRFVNQKEWYLEGNDFKGLRGCGDIWLMQINWDVLIKYEETGDA